MASLTPAPAAVFGLHPGRKHKRFPALNIASTAQALGISKSYLSKVLNGTCKPSLKHAIAISQVLNITIEELNSYADKHKENQGGHSDRRPGRKIKRKR